LHLLIEKKVKKITINDFDRSIYAFWYSVLNHTEELCDLIKKTPIDIENWYEKRQIQKNKLTTDLLELGFSTLFMNRTNISGIVIAGVIGGLKQQGKYKIDCRFNKESIISRIKLIASLKKDIDLKNLDAIELIKTIQKKSKIESTLFYFDPPYYDKGPSLYMNFYKHDQHVQVSESIKNIKNMSWLVSYDNQPEIHDIYSWAKNRIIEYSFNHSAHKSRVGKEVIITSESLKQIPEVIICTYKS